MEDEGIVQLYWTRSESAIKETAKTYGALLLSIAWNILHSREDSEECVNDTYLAVWKSIPPKMPERLPPYLGRITRNLALDRYEYLHAKKRNGGFDCLLDELEECLPGVLLEEELESREIGQAVEAFLQHLAAQNRLIFLRRYWYCQSIADISQDLGMSQSKVKTILFRSRGQLRVYLEQEEIPL